MLLSLGGDGHAAPASFEERAAEAILEDAHLLADRALRDAVGLCGLGKAGGLDEIAEDF